MRSARAQPGSALHPGPRLPWRHVAMDDALKAGSGARRRRRLCSAGGWRSSSGLARMAHVPGREKEEEQEGQQQDQGDEEEKAHASAETEEDILSALICEFLTEAKLRKKTSYKSPRSPKSAYTSAPCFLSKGPGFLRSFKGTENKNFGNSLVKSSRQLWHGPPKQGTRMVKGKPDFDIGDTHSTLPGNTPEYLKEAFGMRKPKHARSSISGYIPGTPDYKEKEDMYDEIIELKKTIQAQKCEADRMKTKLRRLEEENNRKDKQIEQLLDPSRGSEFGWLRPEMRSEISLVNGLKQKILRLEQQCKEKDNAINKLQTDAKNTNVEEMRLSLDTYYDEIQRLHTLLAKSKAEQRKSFPESSQQKVLNTTILQFSRSIKELQDENWKLKADLDHMLHGSPALSKAKNYTEWSRQRLVRRISKLEKKIDELQNDRRQLSQASTSPVLTPSASAHLDLSIAKESDSPEDLEHRHEIVKKLEAQKDVLQDQLTLKEEEIRKLTEKVRELEENQEINCRETGTDATESPDQVPDLSCRSSASQITADCSAEEEAVRLIQSVFRAHITRMQPKGRSVISSPKSEKASPVAYIGQEKPVWFPFKYSPLAFTSIPATSSPSQQQPSPSPLADDVHSDDSDDIITVSPSPVKKASSLDFHSYRPHSLGLS
ncbi:IQ domain-containing protein E isoform X2 [Sceloporus undulatus]|uniref:IQ domain-containing protein E isoform X2 n=1 Tax=Sceloporus undulatus TaxID=8520 RepID=UPI001C4C8FD9|nr:IQ domain-containing protein E isoform X2 [Sceloporus undulatus]